jgi:hypothetical protein
MLAKMQRTHGNVQAISAGFVLGNVDTLYVGGESTSLELPSRPQDVELVRAFLTSPTPEFNFIAGGIQ